MNFNLNALAKKLAVAGFTTLGGAVAGPAGAATVGVIARRIGAAEADPEVIAQAFDADPEVIIRLRELDREMQAAEHEHVERVLAEEAVVAEKEELARQASVQVARTETKSHWLTAAIPLILLGLVAAAGVALFTIEPPDGNRDLVNFLLGNVAGWCSAGIVYWLGSSRGSADKGATLEDLVSRK